MGIAHAGHFTTIADRGKRAATNKAQRMLEAGGRVIVGMRTSKQAARVVELTGGTHPPGKPRRDGTVPLSRYVDVGEHFEPHRAAVESVSVLFELYDGDAATYKAGVTR